MDPLTCPVCGFKGVDETDMAVHFLQKHLKPKPGMLIMTYDGPDVYCFCKSTYDDHFSPNLGKNSRFVTEHCPAKGGVVKHYLETLMGVE